MAIFDQEKQQAVPKIPWEPLQPLDTSCGGKCACSFAERFRYKELPELVGNPVDVESFKSLPDDVRKALNTPFAVGNEVVWPAEGSLPHHAAVMWKHRRAYITFEIGCEVDCPVIGKANTDKMGLFAEPHDILLKQIEDGHDKVFLEILLKDPEGSMHQSQERAVISCGMSYLFLKKSEEVEYRAALDAYCSRSGKKVDELMLEDGVFCFLGKYLPRHFVVADACLSNLPSFMGSYHFVM